jgi:hypothetical protein
MISSRLLMTWMVTAAVGLGCDSSTPQVELDATAGLDALTAKDADPADLGPQDTPLMSMDRGGPRACATANDCDPGEVCLFWDQGCNIQGICAAMCPLLDACAGCNQHCGCDGVTFIGCATRPFAHRGPCGGEDGGAGD